MPVALIYGAAIVAGFWLVSDAAENTGEAVDRTGNGALKLAAAGVVAYVVAKHARLI